MGKKPWKKAISRGSGAEPDQFLTMLDKYERGDVLSTDVVVETNVPQARERAERPEPKKFIKTPAQKVVAPEAVASYMQAVNSAGSLSGKSIPFPEPKKKKDKYAKTYQAGESIIPYGDKRGRTVDYDDDVFDPSQLGIGFGYSAPSGPVVNNQEYQIVSDPNNPDKGYVCIIEDGEVKAVLGRVDMQDGHVEPISDAAEPETHIDADGFLEGFKDMDDAPTSVIEDVPYQASTEEYEEEDEDVSLCEYFTIEISNDISDDETVSYLMIADRFNRFTVPSVLVDEYEFNQEAYDEYIESLGGNLTYDMVGRVVMDLIITTRHPAACTTVADEFISTLTMYKTLDEQLYPRAKYEDKYMLWQVNAADYEVLYRCAQMYGGLEPDDELNAEALKYLIVVLSEAKKLVNVWSPLTDVVMTTGFPKKLEMLLSKLAPDAGVEITPINAPNHAMADTIKDYEASMKLRELFVDRFLIDLDDEYMDGAEFRELGEKLAEALESNPEFAEQVEAVEAAAVKSQFKPSTPGAQAVISSLYGATDVIPEPLKSYKEAVVPVSPVNTPSNKVAKPEQVEKPTVQKPQPTIPVVNNQKKSDDDDNEFRVPIIRKN